MFARVTTYDVPPERCDDSVAAFRQAIEEISVLPGLMDAYLFVDRESGRSETVTFWDSADAMAASRVRASNARTEAAAEIGGSVQSTYEYEVCVHERGRAPAGAES